MKTSDLTNIQMLGKDVENYTKIDVKRVVNQTDKAANLHFTITHTRQEIHMERETWIPKSQIRMDRIGELWITVWMEGRL